MLSSLEPRANDALRRSPQGRPNREPASAYAADALVELVTRRREPRRASVSGPPRHAHPRRCDRAATRLRRGWRGVRDRRRRPGARVHRAAPCFPSAFVKILVTDGVDILSVSHVGRRSPPTSAAPSRSATHLRGPRVRRGCGPRDRPLADRLRAAGAPRRWPTWPALCHFHHAMKTYRGFELRGGPGKWEWEAAPTFETTGHPSRSNRGAARAGGPAP